MQNPVNQSNPQLLNCMQAIITYQKLLLLLRGEFPPSLLPPAPDGYLLKRIEELASKWRFFFIVFSLGFTYCDDLP
jgi:hypothetical protein